MVLSTLAVLEAKETEVTQGLCLESESAQELPWRAMTFTVREKQGCGRKAERQEEYQGGASGIQQPRGAGS